MDADFPVLMTPQDVGLWLSLPTNRVIRLARQGVIPCLIMPFGEVLFDRSDLIKWINEKRKTATDDADSLRQIASNTESALEASDAD